VSQEQTIGQPIEGEHDYIIVGAGSAGCLLANRLSAHPGKRVLILEAGGNDNWIWFHIPVGYLFAIGNPRSDWCFKTEPEPGLNGRSLNYPRGKVIGGSSAINAMIYMRGQAADYDHWRQLGLAGWAWDDVLPYFRRHENHFMGESAAHASGGEWHIEAPRVRWDLLDAFRAAAGQAGIKSIADFNCGDNEGCCVFHVNQKRGRRVSTARAFLKPALKRPNLRLETGCLVDGLIFEDRRAVGVRWRQGDDKSGVMRSARCRGEVVLAAGAIGSPQILMLSGIGPAEHLRQHGIDVVLDHAGVGANLQDHLQLRMIFKVQGIATLNERYHAPLGFPRMLAEYALLRRGPLTMAPSQLGLFTRSDRDQVRQSAVSYPTAVARPLRRTAAQISGLHHERMQSATDQPRQRAAALARRRGGADHRTEIPLDRRGSPHRRKRDPAYSEDRGAAGAGAVPSGRIFARPRRPRRRRSGSGQSRRRYRHDDLPSGRHRKNGTFQRSAGRGR
jgi:choline dehydrogenase-like flavoprotein